MKTYVEVYFSTEGEKASAITQKLKAMGFDASFGEHDFVYEWKDDATMNDVLYFVDKVQSKLSGSDAILKFTTIR
jgi:hypothetical protein